MMFKVMNGMTPAFLENIFTTNIGRSVYNLRISRRNLLGGAGYPREFWMDRGLPRRFVNPNPI